MKYLRLFVFILSITPQLSFGQSTNEAKALIDNEQFNEVSSMMFQLITKEPDKAIHYYLLADKLILQDRVDSALKMLEAGRLKDTANPYIKIGFAKELMNRANLDEARVASEKDADNSELALRYKEAQVNVAKAKSLIDQAVAVAPPKTTELLLEAAEALLHYENFDTQKAKTLLDRCVALDAKNVEAHLLFGDLYALLNNGSLSAEYYNKALQLDPRSPRAIVSKGKLYYRTTNYQGAKVEFEDAINRFPSYTPAHRELAETLFKLGKLDDAKSEYKKYLEMSNGGCFARNRYAAFLYLSKDFEGAVSQCKTVLSMCDPTNPRPLRVMTISYYELKDYASATEYVNKLLKLVPVDERISKDYEYHGKILVATNQDSLGIEQLKAAHSLDPSRADLLSEIGNDFLKIKKYPEAINYFKQKVDGGKEVKSADLYNLGRSYYYNLQFLEADTAFGKLTTNSPKYAAGYLWRAKANAQLDSTSVNGLARPYYEKYIELAMADSVNATKYQSGLAEAYGYMAYYHVLMFDKNKTADDKTLALEALRKKALLPLDPEEAKSVQQAIKQLETGK
ncbi:MAG: tetratricopeptide repeat protein [Bacteroidota bacterium]